MKVVVIYGPPGVGKLTVARELARQIEFKLLHNHLFADLIESVIPFGSKEFVPLMDQMRLTLLTVAKRNKAPGVILTGVYAPKGTVDLTGDFIAKVARVASGQVCLVQLTCDEKELYRRVKLPSRRRFRKVHKVNTLCSLLRKYKLYETVKLGKSLIIDNTNLSAKVCARRIAAYYKLRRA